MKLDDEIWLKVRKGFEAGHKMLALAKNFSVSSYHIEKRATVEGWNRNRRKAGKLEVKPSEESKILKNSAPKSAKVSYFTENFKKSQENDEIGPESSEILKIPNSDLAKLVELPPSEFQPAFLRYLQTLLAQGLNEIPAPRNINELNTLAGLWRKFSGLDVKATSQGNLPMVSPLRIVTRRPSQLTMEVASPASETVGTGDSVVESEFDGFEI